MGIDLERTEALFRELVRATGGFIAGAIYRFNNHRQASSTPIRQDKQMPNTASALLDTATEPGIAVEG